MLTWCPHGKMMVLIGLSMHTLHLNSREAKTDNGSLSDHRRKQKTPLWLCNAVGHRSSLSHNSSTPLSKLDFLRQGHPPPPPPPFPPQGKCSSPLVVWNAAVALVVDNMLDVNCSSLDKHLADGVVSSDFKWSLQEEKQKNMHNVNIT